MIERFYTIETGLDEVNCFSPYETYWRMVVAGVPKNNAQLILAYVNEMRPNDYISFGGEGFGRVEIRCWKYEND